MASTTVSGIADGWTSSGNPTRCLEVDHRELDGILDEVEDAAKAGEFPQSHELFARFHAGLLRHIQAEEDVLFPMLVEADPRAAGPVSVMRFEHQDFRELLTSLASQLAASAAEWRNTLWRLKQGLVSHNMKEERMLYPMADDAAQMQGRSPRLGQELRAALVGKT
jgi:regulator of cell morphogenesis and NO signaling